MLSVGVPAPLWNWKLRPCQKYPHNHIQATLVLLSRNGTTYWREAGYVWSDILDRARAVEADDLPMCTETRAFQNKQRIVKFQRPRQWPR
jgi:hypothetical protein